MSRLIDADAMIDGWIDGVNEPIYSANDVIDDIDEQPTVDAVEVVRCKNCEHYDKNVTIDETLSYCDMQECYEEPNDYCCYGIKKGGAE